MDELLDLTVGGVPKLLNYYADIYYGTDYDTDLDSYYVSVEVQGQLPAPDQAEIADGVLPAPTGTTPREQVFLQRFEAELEAGLARDPAAAGSAEEERAAVATGGLEFSTCLF